jgi:Fur family ferric uptake transcriptional regulator
MRLTIGPFRRTMMLYGRDPGVAPDRSQNRRACGPIPKASPRLSSFRGNPVLPAIEVSQSPEEKFREYLMSRPRPQRYTGQQRDMVLYIFSKHNHFDADQLVDEMKDAGFRVSRATIYRTLNKLVDAGLLRRLDFGPRMFYEHDYGYPQHEHMFCTACHKVIEFQHNAIADILAEVCQKENFQMEGHSFIVRGVCADCNQKKMTKRRLDLV